MYNIKKIVFTDLTKNQKADFLSFIKLYVKNFQNCDEESIYYNLLDELEYFHKLNQNKYDYINIENEQQLSDIKKYIKACKKHFDYKTTMRPVYEEQRRIQKEIRHKITEEKQKSLFAQYVSYASAHNELGIGLGLYASKKIIEAHDGNIFIQSTLDNKNTFGFEIPKDIQNKDENRFVYF